MTGFPGIALPTGPSVLFFGAGEVTARAVSPVDPQPVIRSSCPHRDGTNRSGRNLAAGGARAYARSVEASAARVTNRLLSEVQENLQGTGINSGFKT